MNKRTLITVKLCLSNIKIAYLIAAIVFASMIQNYISGFMNSGRPGWEGNEIVSAAPTLYLLMVLMAIFIMPKVFRRLINLGGKRIDFFKGCAFVYITMTAVAAAVSLLITYLFDAYALNYVAGVLDLNTGFGFTANGPVVAFFRCFALMLSWTAFAHLFVCMQGKWYGWALDIALIVILCVFIPIAPLRAVVQGFFYLTIFNPNAGMHILVCLVLAAAVYLLSWPVLNRKPI